MDSGPDERNPRSDGGEPSDPSIYGGILSDRKPRPKTDELVKTSYQPTKSEIEKEWEVPEGLTFEKLTDAIARPVAVRWLDKPRSRKR